MKPFKFMKAHNEIPVEEVKADFAALARKRLL